MYCLQFLNSNFIFKLRKCFPNYSEEQYQLMQNMLIFSDIVINLSKYLK